MDRDVQGLLRPETLRDYTMCEALCEYLLVPVQGMSGPEKMQRGLLAQKLMAGGVQDYPRADLTLLHLVASEYGTPLEVVQILPYIDTEELS
jgi:hypothetical protein